MNYKMKIKIKKLNELAIVPQYAHDDDAAFDLCSTETFELQPTQFHTFGTGMAYEIPEGYVGLIRPRSGLASRFGIRASSSGVIDPGYRGEVMVTLINHGAESKVISSGDRIAQMLIQQVEHVQFELVDELSDTLRGSGGHGSTGV